MKSDYMKKLVKAAGVRALKTLCQAAVAGIGAAAVMGDVSWGYVVSSSVLAAVVSILMSFGLGLPEVELPKLPEG